MRGKPAGPLSGSLTQGGPLGRLGLPVPRESFSSHPGGPPSRFLRIPRRRGARSFRNLRSSAQIHLLRCSPSSEAVELRTKVISVTSFGFPRTRPSETERKIPEPRPSADPDRYTRLGAGQERSPVFLLIARNAYLAGGTPSSEPWFPYPSRGVEPLENVGSLTFTSPRTISALTPSFTPSFDITTCLSDTLTLAYFWSLNS